jgi:hypothetical protein
MLSMELIISSKQEQHWGYKLMKIVLTKPINFDGEDIKELELNLDDMTGKDLATAERVYLALGGQPTALSLSIKFNQCLAVKAMSQPLEIFDTLGLFDSNRIVMEVQNFLLDMGSQKRTA